MDKADPEGAAAGIVIGAVSISEEVFDGRLGPRQVYRLAQNPDWPFFKIAGKWAIRPSAARAKMAALEKRP